jgi:DNA-directed RNA polymerase delta subunit
MFGIHFLVIKMFNFAGENVCSHLHMSTKHLPSRINLLYYDLLTDFKF